MPCFHPLTAYKTSAGEVVFYERAKYDITHTLSLPCGQCIGCRLERSRQWAVRCMHEASLHKFNCFVTLTYNDEHLPYRGMLEYPAYQKFMKRLRWEVKIPVRFYMCGEYGPENWRPHYHACLFGMDFVDKKYWRTSDSGEKLFRSPLLEKLWPYGHCEIGAVTFESAAYVARYCVQKVTGHNADAHYRRTDKDGEYSLPPEFNHMSLKPGIGAGWMAKYGRQTYDFDTVIVNGKECKPPKYYDRLFSRENPEEFEDLQWLREQDAKSRSGDNTPERLAVKEIVTRSRVGQLYRSL